MELDLFLAFTTLALIPSITFIIEITLGIKPLKLPQHPKTNKSCLVIIPAHDEEAVIGEAISSIRNQLTPEDRILVVADNCSDATAEIAQRCQCEVIARIDTVRRGKGYALDFAIRHVASTAPEILIVIDADCVVLPNAIERLKAACVALARPVQGSYLMTEKDESNAMGRITQFAVYLKNHVRPLGLNRLGGSSPITGSGFAVQYEQLRNLPPSEGEVVEDMRLGLDLLLAGRKVMFLPHAHITSHLPENISSVTTQHKRWEHGHIRMIASKFPRLLKHAAKNRSWQLLISAIDLAIPPFTLLLLLNFFLLVVTALWHYFVDDVRPLTTVATTVTLQFFLLLLVNQTLKSTKLRIVDIKGCISFICSKRGIYSSLIKGNLSSWIKTDRTQQK